MFRKILDANLIPERINLSLLIFRIGLGGMMLTHGGPKLIRVISGNLKFADPIGLGSEISLILAVFGEFFGSLMIIFGIGTRIGGFLGAATMAVAGFIHHFEDPFGTKEKAFLFLLGFILIIIAGPGKYSIDARLK